MQEAMMSQEQFSTIVEFVRWRGANQPALEACTFLADGSVSSLTFGELDRYARAIGAELQRQGLASSRVLLFYQPGLDYIAAFLGCLFAGVVAVPVYPPQSRRFMQRITTIAENAGASTILTTQAIFATLQRQIERIPALSLPCIVTDTLAVAADVGWSLPSLDREQLAFLQYTSGSTAQPKGVMVTHGNIMHNLELIRQSFQLTPQSRGVIWLPPYHDMGLIGGILGSLYVGSPVTLMAPMAFLQQPFLWLETISRTRATVSGGPNFAFELCVQKISPEQRAQLDLSSWEVAFCGAEPVHSETLDRFSRVFAECGFRYESFYPCYGLAEATLIVTGGDQTAASRSQQFAREDLSPTGGVDRSGFTRTLVSCGRPLPGLHLAIVDPQTHRRCEEGQVGEIWLAGPSIAKGYWNAPEQTEEAFNACLIERDEGSFLRTGDLGLLVDGELYVSGRLKNMLILRGVNYYAEDIEQAVEEHFPIERIGRCAAFSLVQETQEQLVIALEVQRHVRSTSSTLLLREIRSLVAEEFGVRVYAIALVKLNGIPKTSSGKLQRTRCRSAFLDGTLSLVTSEVYGVAEVGTWTEDPALTRAELLATPLEERPALLLAYLRQVLAHTLHLVLTERDSQRSLHALGCDSLTLIEVKNTLEERLGLQLALTTLFDDLTLAQLASSLCGAIEYDAPVPEPVLASNAELVEFPLSAGQRALWFLHQFYPESAAYNVSFAIQLQQPLVEERMSRSLQALVERHPSLRTRFSANQGQPFQRVLETVSLAVERRVLTGEDEQAWANLLEEEVQRPFDLEHEQLFRVLLWQHPSGKSLLLFVAHHIVVDFRSLVQIAHELLTVYQGKASVVAPPPSRYADYVFWQKRLLRGERGEQLRWYWSERLRGAQERLELPCDRARPARQTFNGAACPFVLSPNLSRQLKTLAFEEGVTLFMLLLAALQVLLYRYTGQEDILIGTPATGRLSAKDELTVGYYANPVVLRAQLDARMPFRVLLQQARQSVVEGLEHQDLPFPQLVEMLQPMRDQSRAPLFQVMFVLYRVQQLDDALELFLANADHWSELDGLPCRAFPLQPRAVPVDLALSVLDSSGALSGTFQYNTDLFKSATIQRLLTHWQLLLDGLVARPESTLQAIPLLTAREYQEQVEGCDSSYRLLPDGETLHGLFEQWVPRQREELAIISGGQHLSYVELETQANRLAHYLARLGVGQEGRVGLAFPRERLETFIAILAILKVGAIYVPLDLAYPSERLAFIISDAELACVLTLSPCLTQLEGTGEREQFVCLDKIAEALQALPDVPLMLPGRVHADQLAYIIYTSGSTGTPKGVGCSHRNVLNNITNFARRWEISPGLRWSLWTSITFDVSAFEIFLPLITGGTLFPQPEEVRIDPELCFVWLAQQQIQGGYLPPFLLASLQKWLAERHGSSPALDLRYLLVGVESISEQILLALLQQLPALRILNGYGPTEATICVTLYEPGKPLEHTRIAPIGRPMQNVVLYVLDELLQPVPSGVVGELYLGGASLARGYIGRADLTAERFIPHPWSKRGGERLYRTGDLVRWLPEGQLIFVGRADRQLKFHGFRIEPGEIESRLALHPAVKEALVLRRQDQRGQQALVAYLVSSHGREQASIEDLRSWLRQRLPTYMVPAFFLWQEHFPVTVNGKIDQQALLALPLPGTERSLKEDKPHTPLEAELVALWAELLEVEHVGIYEDFFMLGGHSLLAIRLVSRISACFHVELPLHQLFEHPTVAGLAKAIEQEREASSDEPKLVARARSTYYVRRVSL